MNVLLLIFLGGGLGSLARYAVSRIVTTNFSTVNPIATLVANLTATAILGGLLVLASQRGTLNYGLRAFLIVGFCGGFSTFSTFSFETFELIKQGNLIYAVLNVVVSVLLALAVLYFISKTS